MLIFLSQFVLGIGNTLYYSLGQTYLDDNTKKTNTPMMLAYAMSLRMFGPVIGFLLGYVSLRLYIDPTKTPLINSKDPRWLGAWWLGWLILGFSMLFFSWLIGMFPKELPKTRLLRQSSELPKVLRAADRDAEEQEPFKKGVSSATEEDVDDFPKLKDFPAALMRLLRNKLLMYNILSAIFYILGSSGYITFLSKYMEVQFNKNASDATIVTGPVTIIGMVSGFMISGWFISKYRPTPRRLFFWNIVVGASYMIGQVVYMFLTCDNNSLLNEFGALNLTATCNSKCSCDSVSYSPVCHEPSGETFFSPCHAGCNEWNEDSKTYSKCLCGGSSDFARSPWFHSTASLLPNGHGDDMEESVVTTPIMPIGFTVPNRTISLLRANEQKNKSPNDEYEELILPEVIEVEDGSEDYDLYVDPAETTAMKNNNDETLSTLMETTTTTEILETSTVVALRRKRDAAVEAFDRLTDTTMLPGACLAGCAYAFYMFTGISLVINLLGATGRIGNILLNFR